VRYAETDQMGIVYYANYLVWFEVARTDLLRVAGWSYREMEADGCALPVTEAHCAYRRSARYDDELDIRTEGQLLSPVRVRFDYQVMRAVDGTLLADGHTVHASLDPQGRPRRLPERVASFLTGEQ
jgi:acyl-CoA thioester hydrolase